MSLNKKHFAILSVFILLISVFPILPASAALDTGVLCGESMFDRLMDVSMQRHTHYSNGVYWSFYLYGTNNWELRAKYSVDGEIWNNCIDGGGVLLTMADSGPDALGHMFTTYFDGTYIHLICIWESNNNGKSCPWCN